MGKILGAIAILIILFAVASEPISQGITMLRSDNITQSTVVVTSGSSNATVTLTRDLYLNSPDRVGGITSNVTETPVAISYVSASKALTIDGLDQDASHLLSINYAAETSDTMWATLGPFMSLLIYGTILAGIGTLLYKGFKRR